jgi:hypothetical protein
MRLKLLDKKNCYALLPQVDGLRIDRILDEYLHRQVNHSRGDLSESVDALITHNRSTTNQSRGSERLCDSPIEIALIYNVGNQEPDLKGLINPFSGPANFHTIFEYEDGIIWKIIIPLQYLLKGWGDANYGYQCYVHTISNNVSHINSVAKMQLREVTASDDYPYIGITRCNWLRRFSEHMGEMGRGSRKRFHRAWRESMGVPDVHFISHLVNINLTYQNAMDWEEYYVDRVGSNRLNMIPGGFKGLKHLFEHRITDRTDITLEERDRAIAKYARQNPKKGIPNPFIAELWKDDEYYLKIIEARPKTLSPDQVRKIRELARMDWPVAKITGEVGALNDQQVKNVITGRTYSRIK